MTAPKQNPFDAMCDGTITSRYQDREDRLADWNRQLTQNRLLLDSLAPKENAAREILSSDVLPPDGVLFGSSNAHKSFRRMLIDACHPGTSHPLPRHKTTRSPCRQS
jgi:hypothetical protein